MFLIRGGCWLIPDTFNVHLEAGSSLPPLYTVWLIEENETAPSNIIIDTAYTDHGDDIAANERSHCICAL